MFVYTLDCFCVFLGGGVAVRFANPLGRAQRIAKGNWPPRPPHTKKSALF